LRKESITINIPGCAQVVAISRRQAVVEKKGKE